MTTTRELDRALAVLSTLAALIVVGLIGVTLFSGVSQEFFQAAHTAEVAVARLVAPGAGNGVRLNIALDNLFVIVYGSFAVFLAARFRSTLDPTINLTALVALLLTALLDAAENHHIITMLHSAEQHLPVSTWETQVQMIASNLKFHASYLALFLFAFGYYKEGGLGRWIARILWFFYIPLGIVISVLPIEAVRPWALIRIFFFVLAFALSAVLFMGSAARSADA